MQMATTTPSSFAGPDDFHPLELIPFFRRWPCGFWRDILYTFIWNTGLATVFALFALMWVNKPDFARALWLNFVYAQCVGYTIHALFLLVPRRLSPGRFGRFAYYTIVPVVGVVLGFAIGQLLLGRSSLPSWFFSLRGIGVLVLNSLLISGLILAIMIPRERAAKAQAHLAAAQRETALAQLKALEAQVEPHFLYNTLAHVVSLIDAEPRRARGMLDQLIALLRATSRAGNGDATLGGQAELLRAYLDILAMRMGARLQWTIDVPPSLAQIRLPPAFLQPLVENAVKHGLEPKIEGGTITVTARQVGGALELSVSDTGRGFGSATAPIGGSTNLGLTMLRHRLSALYGDAATLALAENPQGGVRATITIPMQPT